MTVSSRVMRLSIVNAFTSRAFVLKLKLYNEWLGFVHILHRPPVQCQRKVLGSDLSHSACPISDAKLPCEAETQLPVYLCVLAPHQGQRKPDRVVIQPDEFWFVISKTE
ncbi:hypothetical protein Ciccas_011061 [Cichlidogyrus casuarinus]|uniref:Uncharacterized protein n=1 Tax=Cichlidogyrus casuarinus TaxID=1844966 RepID=A0ABD2PT58_9PLAT